MKLQRKINYRILLSAAIIICVSSTTAWAVVPTDDTSFTLEPEFSMDSGDYGGGDTITTYAFSVTGEYEITPVWTLSLTIVPYLQQDETYTDVVLVAGRPVHHFDATGRNPHHEDTHHVHTNHGDREYSRSDSMNAGSTGNHSPGEGGNVDEKSEKNGERFHNSTRIEEEVNRATSTVVSENNTGPGAAAPSIEQEVKHRGSESGIGDTTIDLDYRLVEETDSVPETSLHAGLKIPTADEDKGLGTGKVDYRMGVSLSKDVGRWSLEGGVDYNILGKPDGYDLDNYVSGYGEVATVVLPNTEIAMQLYGAQAASGESKGELALGMKLRYDMEQVGEFSAGLQKGLADGSPDYSVVVGYSISF